MTRTTACKRSQNDDETNGAKRQKITVNVPRRSSNRITRLSTSKMLDDEQIVNAIVSSMGSKLSEKKVLSEKTKINSSANQQNICSKELLSDFELARTSLHVKTVPKHLPCRENEHFDLLRLIESNITSKEGSCIYISGVPGTGKTATVKHVIRELLETPAVKNFDFYEINGMKLSDPTSAFSNLSRMIFKKKFSISQSIDKLEKKFTNNKKNKHTVILVDELDLLVTKNQKVIYNFFDWPSRKNSNLTVIAIANTMDLPERVLLNRVASRLGLTRINFTPYDYNQLIRIVEARLEQIPNAFDADSILYCAKKVSAVSGDARKALDICRRAVEILQSKILQDESPTEVITFEIMQEAVKELFSTSALQFLMCATLQQKIFLGCLLRRIRLKGVGEVEFYDILFEHQDFCRINRINCPSLAELTLICSQLGSWKCLIVENSDRNCFQRIKLNLMEEDVIIILRNSTKDHKCLKNLQFNNLDY